VFYGLAVMDAAWSSLSVETHSALCDALSRTIGSMTNQVTMHILMIVSSSLPFDQMNAIDCNMIWCDLLLMIIICIDEQSEALLISSHPLYRKKPNMLSLLLPLISHIVIIYFLFLISVLMCP
jgi:hypothetical protein